MTGTLSVPLHPSPVGDIAVLPPCETCGNERTIATWTGYAWGRVRCRSCAVPVVGQVVAHVEKCPTCDEGFETTQIGCSERTIIVPPTSTPVVATFGPCWPFCDRSAACPWDCPAKPSRPSAPYTESTE